MYASFCISVVNWGVIFSVMLKVGSLDHMWQQSHNRVQDGIIPDSLFHCTCMCSRGKQMPLYSVCLLAKEY